MGRRSAGRCSFFRNDIVHGEVNEAQVWANSFSPHGAVLENTAARIAYPFDSAPHLSRYSWSVENLINTGDTAVDLGCGTGFGTTLISNFCSHVTGVDLDPGVVDLPEKWRTTNVSYDCDNACSPDLLDRVPVNEPYGYSLGWSV